MFPNFTFIPTSAFQFRGVLSCLYLMLFLSISAGANSTDKIKISGYGFVENKGQMLDQNNVPNQKVLFGLTLPGINVNLTKTGFSYDVWKALPSKANPDVKRNDRLTTHQNDAVTYEFHRVDVEFVNMNPACLIQAQNPASDLIRFLTYGTPQNGLLVSHFSKVTYKDLYPGIDLEFVARPGSKKPVEYNFILHPGADVSQIKMLYQGADQSLLKEGALCLKLKHSILSESIPDSWLDSSKEKVAVSYKVLESNPNSMLIGFEAPPINLNESLIIDPVPSLRWGTYYGGTELDQINAVSSFGVNTIFISGVTQSPAGIATSGAYLSTYGGGFFDGYLAKFDTAGVRQWASYFGGIEQDRAFSVKADNAGNVYVVGNTQSNTNISTPGSHQPNPGSINGTYDGFLAKFNGNGGIVWSTYYGGTDEDRLNDLVIDSSGSVLVCGSSQSINNISSPGAHQPGLASVGILDGFVAKFSSSGIRQWATYYGGQNPEEGFSICSDNLGNVFFSGSTQSANNIASPGAHQPAFGGGFSDGFLVKYDPTGIFQWGTYYGGLLEDVALGVAVDVTQNIYLTGASASLTGISSAGAFQTAFAGGNYDGFLAKFSQTGTRQWGTYVGGADDDRVFNISDYVSGGVLLTGLSYSTSGIATTGAYQTTMAGSGDTFIIYFDISGSRQWGTYYGGTGQEVGLCVEQSPTGDIFLCGFTNGSDGVATSNVFQPNYGGGILDGFLARFTVCINLPQPTISVNNPFCSGVDVNFSTPSVSNATYIWTGPNGFFSNLQNPVIPNATAADTGLYSLVIEVGSCLSPPFLVNLTIEPAPVASILSDISICVSDTLTFSINTTSSVNAILWNFDDPASGSNNTSISPAANHVFLASGSYSVSAIVEFNCVIDTLLTNITVFANPSLSTSATDGSCGLSNASAGVSASGGTGSYTYIWSNGSNSNNISGLSAGTYTVLVSDQNSCSASAQVLVGNTPASGVNLLLTDSSLTLSDSLEMEILGGTSYNWSPSNGLNCTNCATVIASPETTTIYTVTGIDISGCPYARSVKITVDIKCNELFIPDIFTPNVNGPDANETLCVFDNCVRLFSLFIYNRWGEQVFETSDISSCWDGTFKGNEAQPGVYAFKLYAEKLDGSVIDEKGLISLVR